MFVKRIIHTGDLHIKCTLARPRAFYINLAREITNVIDTSGGDIIVIAGDVLDMAEANSNDTLNTCAEFIRLLAIRAPVYVMPGNHDVSKDGYTVLQTICDSVTGVKYATNGAFDFSNIVLCMWSPIAEDLSGMDRPPAASSWDKCKKGNAGRATFLVYHGIIGNYPAHFNVASNSRSRQIKPTTWFDGLGYAGVLLGDTHTAKQIAGGVAYAGSPYQISAAEPYAGQCILIWDMVSKKLSKYPMVTTGYRPKLRMTSQTVDEVMVVNTPDGKPEPFSAEKFPYSEYNYNHRHKRSRAGASKAQAVQQNLLNEKPFNKFAEAFNRLLGHAPVNPILSSVSFPVLKKLWCSNLLGYVDFPVIDFERLGTLTSINGPNGSGKSNILRLVFMSLFGEMGDGGCLSISETVDAMVTHTGDKRQQPSFTKSRARSLAHSFSLGDVDGYSWCNDYNHVMTEISLGLHRYVIIDRFTSGAPGRTGGCTWNTCAVCLDDDSVMDTKAEIATFRESMVPPETYRQLCVMNEYTPLLSSMTPRVLLETLKSLFTNDDESTQLELGMLMNDSKESLAVAKATLAALDSAAANFQSRLKVKESFREGDSDTDGACKSALHALEQCPVCSSVDECLDEDINNAKSQVLAAKTKYDAVFELTKSYRNITDSVYPVMIKAIEEAANAMVAAFGYTVSVSMTTTVRGKTVMDGLDVNLIKKLPGGGERAIKATSCSGFQRFLLDMAIRQALPKIYEDLGFQSATDLVLFIDEGFHRVDDDNKTSLQTIVDNVTDTYANVVVVSHDSQLELNCVSGIKVDSGKLEIQYN